ncbi:hypothetical protein DL98DRAFT_52766 [Cadophora sp. DSE1049]|nr:hypothetical protein DL98DRAFT_52766 [Cadophora sp. DSE1049]
MQFQVLRLLGRGAEGDVHEVKEITTGAVYARKHIQIGGPYGQTSRTVDQVRNEVEIIEKLSHTHITSIAG